MSATIATAKLAPPAVPFRGIESFRFVDQRIFFARKEETRKLIRAVTLYRGVLFYGDSGSGKSSLINAGLFPEAMQEGFAPERLRVQPRRGEEIIVERISTSPDGKPPYLPSLFADTEATATRVVLSTDVFRSRVESLKQTFSEQVPLLIFDQFEEFVTLFEEAPRKEAEILEAMEAQESILRAIVALMRDQQLQIKLLFVFREDYLAKLTKLFALCPDLPDQYLRLTAPDVASLHVIIRGSFEKFPGHFGKELSEDLTNNLAAAIKTRSEGNKVNLSEVQIAGLKLWQSKNPDALFAEKGVQGLLEDYLADALKELPNDLRDPAVALLSRLVTPSGTRNIVSEDDLIAQLTEDENLSEEISKTALRALVDDTKLVRRERRYDTRYYDIVSEFLVPWIMRKKAERLTEAAQREMEAIERLKRRKAYRLTVASLLLAGLIGVVAVYFIKTRTVTALAQGEVKTALSQKEAALAEKEQALAQKLQAEKGQADALAQKHLVEESLNSVQTLKDAAIKDAATQKSRADRTEQEAAQSKKALSDAMASRDMAEKAREQERNEKDKAEKDALLWRSRYNELRKSYNPKTN